MEAARKPHMPVTGEQAKVIWRTADRDLETGDVIFEETTLVVPRSREEVEVDRPGTR